ncbi:MAG: hypothetical protein HYZ92_02120 [Candidatus Omnitrophica bacterium]|nr:hypothetical protein [Candidatus Omnitrophota bacterium]
MKKRPLGLTVFGVIFLFVNALALSADAYLIIANPKPVDFRIIGSRPATMNTVNVILHLLGLATGLGVLKLRRWAYRTGVFLTAFYLLWGVIERWGVELTTAELVGMNSRYAVAMLSLWYFLRPAVKAQFQRDSSA